MTSPMTHAEPRSPGARPARGFSGASTAPARVAEAVARFLSMLATWQARTAQRDYLRALAFDDHMLKSLSLNRADIAREAAKPFWVP